MKKGELIATTKPIHYSCGIVKIPAGSICKVVESDICIERILVKFHESSKNTRWINEENLRKLNSEEKEIALELYENCSPYEYATL
jgi:hypothetical protein